MVVVSQSNKKLLTKTLYTLQI